MRGERGAGNATVRAVYPAHSPAYTPRPPLYPTSAQLEADSARLASMTGELEEVVAALAAHKDARSRSDAERRLEHAVEVRGCGAAGLRGCNQRRSRKTRQLLCLPRMHAMPPPLFAP